MTHTACDHSPLPGCLSHGATNEDAVRLGQNAIAS